MSTSTEVPEYHEVEARQIQVAGVQGGEKEALEEERGKVQLSEK